MNQWQAAPLKPKHLAALCIWEGSSDYYRELCRHGGILSDFYSSWYPRQVTAVQHGVGERGAEERRHRRAGGRAAEPVRRRIEEEPRRLRRRRAAPSADRRLPQGAAAEVRGHRDAAVLGRQLGRHGAAPARQFRRLSARRLEAEMAGGARRHALHAVLREVRPGSAAAVLRPLPEGHRQRLGEAARRCCSRSAIPARNSSRAPRTNGRSRARNGPSSICIPTASSTCSRPRTRDADLRDVERRRELLDRAADRGDGDHRPGRGQAVRVVGHHRRRPVPGAAGVRSARQGGHVHRLERSARAGRARLAARLAPQARSEGDASPTGPGTPTTRNSRSSPASRSSSTSRSGRPRSWCRRAIAWR